MVDKQPGTIAPIKSTAPYAGGYFFDRSTSGFDAIAGPRVRAELRLYDLDWLGAGSRLVLGGQYQYDDVRGSQGGALLQVRVPFGPGASRPMNRLQRRMLNAIVRDDDIVTNTGRRADERALLAKTNQRINAVTVVDGMTSNVPGVVAAASNDPGDLVVFDSSQGTIQPSATIQLQPGQTIGGQFQVIGETTGAIVTFGQRPTVSDPTNVFDIFTLDDGTSLLGLNITGGANGIGGDDVTGFSLCDNHVSSAVGSNQGEGLGNGLRLQGENSGQIIYNVFMGNETNGLQIREFTGGLISGNTASQNGDDGFDIGNVEVGGFSGGIFENNVANENMDDGFDFVVIEGGEIRNNRATGNSENGFKILEMDAGIFSGNISGQNGDDGFDFDGFLGGVFENNSASGNSDDGFDFEFVEGGEIRNNRATGNSENGFEIFEMDAGIISGNIASQSGDDGFDFGGFLGGVFENNSASGNSDDGFDFEFVEGGVIRNNRATNSDENGFDFDLIEGGQITNNQAADNTEDGFFIFRFAGQNMATFANNSALRNTVNGYNIIMGIPQTGGGNMGSGNGANDVGP
jgi:parallel beta-helix repeat protein